MNTLRLLTPTLIILAIFTCLTTTTNGLKVIVLTMNHLGNGHIHISQPEGSLTTKSSFKQVQLTYQNHTINMKKVILDHFSWSQLQYHISIDNINVTNNVQQNRQLTHFKLPNLIAPLSWLKSLKINTIKTESHIGFLKNITINNLTPDHIKFSLNYADRITWHGNILKQNHTYLGTSYLIPKTLKPQKLIFTYINQKYKKHLTLHTSGKLANIELELINNPKKTNASFNIKNLRNIYVTPKAALKIKKITGHILLTHTGITQLNIQQLLAQLNHHNLKGKGHLSWLGNQLKELNIELLAPQYQDQITINMLPKKEITHLINIHDLSLWLPEFSGKIYSNTSYLPKRGIYGLTEIKNLYFKNFKAKLIKLTQRKTNPELKLDLKNIQQEGFKLDQASFLMKEHSTLSSSQFVNMLSQYINIKKDYLKPLVWVASLYPNVLSTKLFSCYESTSNQKKCDNATQSKKSMWREFEITSEKLPLKDLNKWLPSNLALNNLKGDCFAKVSLAINIEKPWQVRGNILLKNIHFKHFESKTTWKKGHVKISISPLSVSANGSILLNGSPITLSANTTFTPHSPIKLTIQGHAIPLEINPRIKVSISPNVEVIKEKNSWNISGSTYIENGLIQASHTPGIISLPTNTTIVGEPVKQDLLNFLTKFLNGTLHVKTRKNINVENLFGFQGGLSGDLEVIFRQQKSPTANGSCSLQYAQYISHPNIKVILAKVSYNNNQLNNPIIDFRLTRYISEVIFDLNNPTQIFHGKKVGLIISGSAKWPQYDLYSDDTSLTKIQIITALLSGSPNGFSPDQEVSFAMSLMHTSPQSMSKPMLSPLTTIKQKLGLDQLYLSTPLENEDLLHNNLNSTNLTIAKSFFKNLVATYRINISTDDYLLALNYLINPDLKVQLYSTHNTENLLPIHSNGLNIIMLKSIQ